MSAVEPVKAGQMYAQARPAPGFAAVTYLVVREAERAGWWWCRSSVGGERRIPERALQNADVYVLSGGGATPLGEFDSWATATKRQRLDLLGVSLEGRSARDGASRDRIMARVERHFGADRMDDPMRAINVVLREAWREDHDGDVSAWDAAAAAAGMVL